MIDALKSLRNRQRIKKDETVWVRRYFRALKQSYTNKELSMLTGWNEERLKKHTRGIDTAATSDTTTTPPVKEVSKFVASNLTVEDAKQVNSFIETLDSNNVSVKEVASVIAEARIFNMDIHTLVSTVKAVKTSGLSMGELREVLTYKGSLESLGIGPNRLREMFELIAEQGEGSFETTMNFIKKVISLQALQYEITELTSKKDDLSRQVGTANNELTRIKEQHQAIRRWIDLVAHLEKRGFNRATLENLATASQNYGGPKEVIKAIEAYAKLEDLRSEIDNLAKRKNGLENEVAVVEFKLAGLEGQARGIEVTINKTLESTVEGLGKTIDREEQLLVQTFEAERGRLSTVIDQYAKVAKDAERLKEELDLAEVILAAERYPISVNGLHPILAIKVLDLAAKILAANGFATKTVDVSTTVYKTIFDTVMALSSEIRS